MLKTDGVLCFAEFTAAGPMVMVRRMEKTHTSQRTWHVFYGGTYVSGPHHTPRGAYDAAGVYGYRYVARPYEGD